MVGIVTEKSFEYKGFLCVINFMPNGYRCGYVGIPNKNPLYKKEINLDGISCHGGVTYHEEYLNNLDENAFWIGFDCGHCFDGFDEQKARELYADCPEAIMSINRLAKSGYFDITKNAICRSLDYCEEQCKGIVNQLLCL